MRSRSSIEKKFLGFPLSVRHWLETKNCKFHTEYNLSRNGYLSTGLDLFDDDEDIMIHVRLIWLWLSIGVGTNYKWVKKLRKKITNDSYRGRQFRLTYFGHSINWEIWRKQWESNSTDPWWMSQSFYMPWHTEWVSTEVLSLDLVRTVYIERRKERKLGSWSERWDVEQQAKKDNSITVDYTYILKDGRKQERKATICAGRRFWGYSWLPLPINSSTYIDVSFNDEVGEKSGSWKGGCIGSSYEMKPGETAIETLRRMEFERKF